MSAGTSAPEPPSSIEQAAPRALELPHSPEGRALASLRPEAIAADVEFLACDDLAGRGTPSLGQRIAARFMIQRLEHLGLEPGARAGWIQEIPLQRRHLDARRVTVALLGEEGALELTYGEDFGLHPMEVIDGAWTPELVYCGTGSRDELEGVDLAGRWAVCVPGEETRNRRRRNIERAGAGGMFAVAGPEDEARFSEWFETQADGRARQVSERSSSREPVVWLSSSAAAALLDGEPELGARLDLTARVAIDSVERFSGENLCAFVRGSDLAQEVILVSAHYDHLGVREGEVFNGADDNASGSAGLLALAEALQARGPLRRSVLLLWVTGEELGFLGSKGWVEDLHVPGAGTVVCNINLDMIGRNAPQFLEYTPTPEHPRTNRLGELVARLAGEEGFSELVSADRDFERSDHFIFAERLDVPIVYMSGGEHADYHEATDDADKIDADKIARVLRVVLRLIEELQEDELNLEPAGTLAGAVDPIPADPAAPGAAGSEPTESEPVPQPGAGAL